MAFNLTYKYRILLTKPQIELFNTLVACRNLVYDTALYRYVLMKAKKGKITLFNLSRFIGYVSDLAEFKFLQSRLSSSLDITIRNLNDNLRRSGYDPDCVHPKSKRNNYASLPFRPKDESFSFKKVKKGLAEINLNTFGPIALIYHRPFPKGSHCLWAVLKRNPSNEFYIYFVLSNAYKEIQPKENVLENEVVGLDFSLRSFFVASDSSIVPDMSIIYPTWHMKKILSLREKNYHRSIKGSKNEIRKKIIFLNYRNKFDRRRNDYFYQLAYQIFEKYEIVGIEKLNLNEMRSKSNYAKMIDKEAYGTFVKILQSVAKKLGKRVIQIDEYFPSSRICSHCGYKNRKLKIYEKKWQCPNCKAELIRDVNAAENIKKEAFRKFKNFEQ